MCEVVSLLKWDGKYVAWDYPDMNTFPSRQTVVYRARISPDTCSMTVVASLPGCCFNTFFPTTKGLQTTLSKRLRRTQVFDTLEEAKKWLESARS